VSTFPQGSQCRKQVTARQIARAAEYDKPVDHLKG
jgi:hypothetical protein